MTKPCLLTGSIIILMICNCVFADAQINLSNWQVGVNAGVMVYQGDLTPSQLGSYRTMKPAFGVYISRILSPSFIARTNLAFGKLHGDDAAYSSPDWRKQRNFNFSSPVKEVSELLVWNIFRNNSNERDKRFSPYLFGGAGLSFLRIRRDYSNMNTAFFGESSDVQNGLNADFARSTPRAILVLPVGAGVEYYLTPHISLTAETNFRYTFTDYLDGFSKSANPSKRDYYHSHTIGLVYKFGREDRMGCPVMKY